MASRRYYDNARSKTSTSLTTRDPYAKRRDNVHRTRQIRDAVAAASIALRPGGFKRSTVGQMQAEKKVIDLNEAAYALSAPGVLTLLNGCVAGSQNYNRIGRKILMKSLQLRLIVAASTPLASVDSLCRIIIVYDKQTNGAAPTVANILQSQNITGVNSSSATDMVNLDNRDRFTILRDIVFALAGQSTTATQAIAGGPTVKEINEYIRLNLDTVFNAGTAGTIGDIQSGSLYMLTIGTVAGFAAVGSTRVRFSDM